MSKDKDYIQMINSARWRRLRRQVLTQHPLCEMCEKEGIVEAATEVHHSTPVEYGVNAAGKRRLMFDSNNLRALCHKCHVRVHTEMGRSGKEATRRRNTQQVNDIISKFFPKTGGGGI